MAARKKTRRSTAKKSSAKSSKSGSGRRTTRATKAKNPRNRSSRAPSSKASSRRKTPAQGTSRAASKSTPSPPPLFNSLPLDRKLDIAGVGMTLVGLLLLLSLLSANRNGIFETIFTLLARGLGWGGYFLPVLLALLGLWLILRNFERVPTFDPERLTGLALIFFNLLVSVHFVIAPSDPAGAYAWAAAGRGGGYVGAFISLNLEAFLGTWGTVVALLAWLLIGLVFTLDTAIADLFRWVPPALKAVNEWMSPRIASLWTRPSRPVPVEPARTEEVTGTPEQSNEPDAVGLSFDLEAPVEWQLPQLDAIFDQGRDVAYNDENDRMHARLIEETLASFGAPVNVVEVKHGPTITMFGVEPGFIESRSGRTRVRVNKIANLADDLALALAAPSIRIQAPVPGEGYVGIEVPNETISLVALRDVIESEGFKRMPPPLRFALGQNVAGTAVAANLAAMPHLLIAGATGSGKSVCINSIICCLLAHNTPDDLRMIMVDPKRVELTNYNGIPHLLAPVVVEMERVVGALQWVTREMDARYQKFHDSRTRNIIEYNRMIQDQGGKKLPYLVVIIDELADLMLLAPDQTEKAITRLAQLARATGIHLIIATQRPSVDVVTGLIKANFPARIAFAVSSGVDSRVILDQPGADRLLGRGDMLFQAPDAPAPVRLQGVFVSDMEINALVHHWRGQTVARPDASALHSTRPADAPAMNLPLKQKPIWEEVEEEEALDPLFHEAVDLIRRQGRASVSMLQRRMRIGYTRAARLIETMEEKGIIGPPIGGAHTREVLDYGPAAPPAGE